MIKTLTILSLFIGTASADFFKPGDPVILTQDMPDPAGSPQRKCGPLLAGAKGVVFNGFLNTSDFVAVKWKSYHKGCEHWESLSYVDVPNLQAQGKNIPATLPIKTGACATVSQSNTMEELLHKTDLADASAIKGPDEIEKYISCYFVGDHQVYLDKFKFMIENAAQEFKVDPALMKCLILRESQYRPEDMSCTCATGLGQQVMQNVDEIGKWVGDSHTRILSNGRPGNDLAKSWDAYMKKIKVKSPTWLNGCSGGFAKSGPITDSNNEFYKSVISHRERGCGSNPTPCTIYQEDDRRCPAASIGATAAYLSLIEKQLKRAVACHEIEWWQVDDSRIAMALAYNAGEGTASHALQNSGKIALMSADIINGSNVSDGKKKEMMGHYRALRNCLQKGNTGSQAVGSPEKRACFTPVNQAGTPSSTR